MIKKLTKEEKLRQEWGPALKLQKILAKLSKEDKDFVFNALFEDVLTMRKYTIKQLAKDHEKVHNMLREVNAHFFCTKPYCKDCIREFKKRMVKKYMSTLK